MQRLKNEKGITLIALSITVFVLSLISVPVVVNMTNIHQFEKYTKFKDDIDNLRESISIAYHNKEVTDIGPKYDGNKEFLKGTQNEKQIKNVNDNENYYVISIEKVNKGIHADMPELNFGTGNQSLNSNTGTYSSEETDDVYIINEQSRTIYYVKGVNYNGEKYYRLNEDFSDV